MEKILLHRKKWGGKLKWSPSKAVKQKVHRIWIGQIDLASDLFTSCRKLGLGFLNFVSFSFSAINGDNNKYIRQSL